jgi:very-short-patch-repair endonuclease
VIVTRDRRKDSAALARGYATVRIPETEFDHDGSEQAQEIRAILANRRPRP